MKYETAQAFRSALEERLRNEAARRTVAPQRLRYMVVFDRFLARLDSSANLQWTLKGGYAMELRIDKARTTKDVDLSIRVFPSDVPTEDIAPHIQGILQTAAAQDLGDFFEFSVGAAQMAVKGAVYGGHRYPVKTYLAGRVFQEQFFVDVVVGDPPPNDSEFITGENWLEFAGLPATRYAVIRVEQQFAEKLHAYTLPRDGNTNSRVKDFVDLVLLTHLGMDPSILSNALLATFDRRSTHALPPFLASPPAQWGESFRTYARECDLNSELVHGFEQVSNFLDPILGELWKTHSASPKPPT